MQRLLKTLLLSAAFVLVGQSVLAQTLPIVQVSGRVSQTGLRVFTKDTLYQIAGDYHVAGILLIEPGTTVEFLPNGRLIDSVGGRIIADGDLQATWNRSTPDLTAYPNGFADISFIRDNVFVGGKPEITAPGLSWSNYAPYLFFYYGNYLDRYPSDPNLKNVAYRRDVTRAPIIFRGRPVNKFSREWGHIVILPGADTAVFRNVQFVNFRKDTAAVKTTFFYAPNGANLGGLYNNGQIIAADRLNKQLRTLTTGGGGALTVFSSKTWLLDCRFDSNFARYHGGAVQFLQAPFDSTITDPQYTSFYPMDTNLAARPQHGPFRYPSFDPEDYDHYTHAISTPFGVIPIMTMTDPRVNWVVGPYTPAPPYDMTGIIQYRQTYDDGRQAINKGRVRRVSFRDNRVVVSNFTEDLAGYRDNIDEVPIISNPLSGGVAKNEAYGGAVYISGRRHVTVYWGRAMGDPMDTVVAERNYAVNFQGPVASSQGARGGAMYVNDSTSMVFQLARFENNFTAVPNVPMDDYIQRGRMSQGGGIYMGKTSPQLTVRDVIYFRNNKAGRGGGIYVAAMDNPFGNNILIFDPFLSPNLLGDSVYFIRNIAEYDGGAIYTQRNMTIDARYLTLSDGSGRLVDHRILLDSNAAGLAGGAIVIDNQTNMMKSNARITRALFTNNAAGDSAMASDLRLIKLYDPVNNAANPINPYSVRTYSDSFRLPRIITQHILGGGAIYSRFGNTNFYQAVEFNHNWTKGGNGGAIAMITPVTANRYFLAEGDIAYNFGSNQSVPFNDGPEPSDMRQMTRFLRNYAMKDSLNAELNVDPRYSENMLLDPKRNGTGLGGAIYINDRQPPGPNPGYARTDSVISHRVRMEQNWAWSGAAVYSDNYELRFLLSKSLVAGNRALSDEGRNVDTIENYKTSPAANRTAGTIFYGDISGPLPQQEYHIGANSIYDNDARFLLRLPDVPQGLVGSGRSGVDTLRGNYWGQTEAPITTVLATGTAQNTFYVMGNGCTLPLKNPTKVNEQGPFESRWAGYNYTPIPVGLIPGLDTLLMQGRVYDLFDKGVDINSADYSIPRMAPIEDFSVGIPDRLRTFGTLGGPNSPYMDKVVRRLTRDPWIADVDAINNSLQREWVGDHPIGYPLFLEALANYLGDPNTDNNDQYALNQTVFFVINAETGEFVRANLKQIREGSDLFRSRIEFVPDSINRDILMRRALEGRAGFSIGELHRLAPRWYVEQGYSLEHARLAAAKYEDSVAVAGRRYGGLVSELGGVNFRYINRVNPVTFADVYGGERYHALPVLTGDRIWVVSRTMLWDVNEDITTVVNNARFAGLEFQIDDDNSVLAPIIYGDKTALESKQPAELRNTRFLIEDANYPSDKTGRIKSQIFDITAVDINGFYDPRSFYFPDRYTGLEYAWTPLVEFPNSSLAVPSTNPAEIRLASWLKADTVFPSAVHANAITRDSAHRYGFVRFYGQPHNPDVVPGGELFEIRVTNYPPSVRTVDSLKGLVADDTVAKYIYLYPPYYNCQVYDPQTARYLQQDTVDVTGAATATYRFRIFVQDTRPNFLGDVAKCPGRGIYNAVAQVTDSLRFDFDINTDDENEDNDAATRDNWSFPYGRTTYGFQFTDRNSGNNSNTLPTENDDAKEIRPVWMGDGYLHDINRAPDQGATVLQTGNVIVRMTEVVALNLLKNPAQSNNLYNTDTIFTIVANDGHTGQNQRNVRVYVNIAPSLVAQTLPGAKEDIDYNPTLLDSNKRIKAEDLNKGDRVRFTLVYRDDALNPADLRTGGQTLDKNGAPIQHTSTIAFVRRDPCYFEAGVYNAPKTTPSWLKINPISGILYGTPGLNDAPHLSTNPNFPPQFGPDTVTVIAEDEYGLTDVETYILEVDSTNHKPKLFGRPAVQCVFAGEAYKDSLCVRDRDLGRLDPRFYEELKLRAYSDAPAYQGVTFTVTPNTIKGATNDTNCFQISANIPANVPAGKMPITVEVTDLGGNKDYLTYEISISEGLIFSVPVRVQNTNLGEQSVAYQDMIFGMARNATTGEEPSAYGRLDSQYCEYEIPPKPPTDVFDARWTIPNVNGVQRNIFPQNPSPGQGEIAWKASYQAGHQDNSSPNLPIMICWAKKDIDTAIRRNGGFKLHIMDLGGGSIFRVDMQNPTGQGAKLTQGIVVQQRANGDTICLVINLTTLDGFKIAYGLTSDAPEEPTTGGSMNLTKYMLAPNAPNPFAATTQIGFYAPKSGSVTLDVYNVNGELVKTLINGTVDAGNNTVEWNGTDNNGKTVASGAYTYRLTAGATVLSRTMILTR